MSAAVSSVPRLTFFDNAGAPLSGGLVSTYGAGTLTPKTTYSNEALSTPISNPIVLNAAGRPVASATDPTEVNVYLSSASYKFVVQTSLGVTLYTADNIEAVQVAGGGLSFPATIIGGVSGGVPYFSSTTTMAASALLTATDVILGGGAGNPPVSQGVKPANTFLVGPISGSDAIMTARVLDPLDLHSATITLANNFTKTTDVTLANITGFSITLLAGKTYNFRIVLQITADATGGAKVGVNGGSATATTFLATSQEVANGTSVTVNRATTLAGALAATALGALTMITIDGYIVVNAGGTFIPQFAQAVSNGSSIVLAGSTMQFF